MELHDFHFFTLETLVIQAIILVCILWVLNRFVFKPYLAYLDEETERRKKLETDYNNIETLNKQAEAQKQDILSDAKKQAEEMKKNALDIAKAEASAIKEKASQEAQNMKNSAFAEISKEKEVMLNDVKEKSIDLIVRFNAKLFEKEKVNRDFVEKEISSL